MESLLTTITQHAMNYAIRSGIAITSGYALQQCTRLLKTVKSKERDELAVLKARLEGKICIISPAIDMIELVAARGNTSLDSAVALSKSIRLQIQSLGSLLAKATDEEIDQQHKSKRSQATHRKGVLEHVTLSLKTLLAQIEDAVPLINLAIATSGVSLSTALPSTVSPSRLLQASMFLATADSAYSKEPQSPMQIGPAYTLSIYMLFEGHARKASGIEGIRETTWQEVIHKARVKLVRVSMESLYEMPVSLRFKEDSEFSQASVRSPNVDSPTLIPSESRAHEFVYQLLIIEDLDDGRVHTFEDDTTQPGPFEDVATAGIREMIPVHEISKIFYADTGKILNIGADGEPNNPVLLLKRDVGAAPPRRMMDPDLESDHEYDSEFSVSEGAPKADDIAHASSPDSSSWRFPTGLDLSWIAFEVYTGSDIQIEEEETDSSDDEPTSSQDVSPSGLQTPLHSGQKPKRKGGCLDSNRRTSLHANALTSGLATPALRTSLSLLELLIRLSSLQQFQQCSHLAISDELLNFFLSESNSTGAGADVERRKHMRSEVSRRVGFDPYAESPVRYRGEDYWDNPKKTADGDLETKDGLPAFSSNSRRQTPGMRLNVFTSSHVVSPSLGSSPSLRPGKIFLKKNMERDRLLGSVGSSLGIAFRTEQMPARKPEPVLRSESDSTLGTSPLDILERPSG